MYQFSCDAYCTVNKHKHLFYASFNSQHDVLHPLLSNLEEEYNPKTKRIRTKYFFIMVMIICWGGTQISERRTCKKKRGVKICQRLSLLCEDFLVL